MKGSHYTLVPSTPALLTEMRNHLSGYGVADPVVLVQLCGIISLLCQGAADVLWPNGRLRWPREAAATLLKGGTK